MKFKISLYIPFLFILSECSKNKLHLKQVLVLSRHNVRTPLSKNLAQMIPKPWPQWEEKSGYLTPKGALLEGLMGEFFYAWLYNEGLMPKGCPTEKDVYVYANTKQRTKASAQAFVNKAFPGCNVTVHCKDTNDPNFTPVIHNTSAVFRQMAIEEMQKHLKLLILNDSYNELEDILDFKQSDICKTDNKCDLVTDKNRIINVMAGEKPNVSGPLKIGNSVIDAFIMENYEGFPLKNVAWGQLENTKRWNTLMNISRGYHNVIFNTTLVAKDIAHPLIEYISNIFLNDTNIPSLVLLMGHDANIYTILSGMGFKSYNLQFQHEKTPIGGKIVFQKWFDSNSNRYLLKINYIYQSTTQLRKAIELSLDNPPQFTLLELEDCKVDKDGFCLWDDFKKLLNNL